MPHQVDDTGEVHAHHGHQEAQDRPDLGDELVVTLMADRSPLGGSGRHRVPAPRLARGAGVQEGTTPRRRSTDTTTEGVTARVYSTARPAQSPNRRGGSWLRGFWLERRRDDATDSEARDGGEDQEEPGHGFSPSMRRSAERPRRIAAGTSPRITSSSANRSRTVNPSTRPEASQR